MGSGRSDRNHHVQLYRRLDHEHATPPFVIFWIGTRQRRLLISRLCVIYSGSDYPSSFFLSNGTLLLITHSSYIFISNLVHPFWLPLLHVHFIYLGFTPDFQSSFALYIPLNCLSCVFPSSIIDCSLRLLANGCNRYSHTVQLSQGALRLPQLSSRRLPRATNQCLAEALDLLARRHLPRLAPGELLDFSTSLDPHDSPNDRVHRP